MVWLRAPLPELLELADLVWPARCAGCAGRGGSWCRRCADELAGAAYPAGPAPVRPTPAPPGMPPVHAWGSYRGVVRTVLVAYKDRDRRDLARVLTPLLAASLETAARHLRGGPAGSRPTPAHRSRSDPLLVVPVPANPAAVRQRGDRPLEHLGRGATALLLATDAVAAELPLAWAPCLRVVRGVGDQAGLDRQGRAANLAGAFAVRPAWAATVRDTRCIVVDDVVTTGATLAEAARALRAAGAATVSCATIAATARRAAGRRAPR